MCYHPGRRGDEPDILTLARAKASTNAKDFLHAGIVAQVLGFQDTSDRHHAAPIVMTENLSTADKYGSKMNHRGQQRHWILRFFILSLEFIDEIELGGGGERVQVSDTQEARPFGLKVEHRMNEEQEQEHGLEPHQQDLSSLAIGWRHSF